MTKIRIGVQLAPQFTTYVAYAQAVRDVEALGVDTIWNWDHFFPPWDYPAPGEHFEAWTLLSAMATLTERAEIGCLVTCNGYRNPALLSNMAKTVDHICGGRLIFGIGAGWFEAEYQEYDYPFGTASERLQALEESLKTIKHRWETDLPLPIRRNIPILIGGDGEKVTLRLAAQYADIWNSGASSQEFKHKCKILDQWCDRIGRDPAAIERSVNLYGKPDAAACDDYVEAGASHLILNLGIPWELSSVKTLVQWRNSRL